MKLPKFNLKSFWKGSTLQLLGVIILPLAFLVLTFTLGSTWLHQRAMRDMVGERDELVVRAAAGALSTGVHHRTAVVRGLTQWAHEQYPIETGDLNPYSFFVADFDLGLALFSTEGELLDFIGDAKFWQKLDIETTPFSRSGNPVMSYEMESDEKHVLLFGSVSVDQPVIAIGAVSTQALVTNVAVDTLPAKRESQIFILNQDRELVYQSNPSIPDTKSIFYSDTEISSENQSGAFYIKTQGVEQVVSFSTVPPLGWLLVMEEPWEAVATPVLEITRIAPLILVPLLFITLAGLSFGARQIVQPLRDLERKAASLTWGNFDEIEVPVGGIAEIRHLQAELTHMARKVQTAQRGLRDYIGVITDAQEEERRRLARELHDDTLQSIIALKQRVQMALKNTRDKTSQRSLEELETIAELTIENLRRTTRALRPIYLEDLGLGTALEMLTKEIESVSDIKVSFQKEGIEKRLAAPDELALYRMAQEALSNVTRHAQAAHAKLSIRYFDEVVELEISDDGVGFDPPQTPSDFAPLGHFGLLGMYERTELLHAQLDIQSAKNEGTRVILTLPF